jgi:hypothetical protein
MPPEPTAEIDLLLTRLWSLLELATETATAADVYDHLEQVAVLCDSAAAAARAAAALR